MKKLSFSKKVKNDFKVDDIKKISIKEIYNSISNDDDSEVGNEGALKYFLPFIMLFTISFLVITSLISLQVFSYDEYVNRSVGNQFEVAEIKPSRGLIVDRYGKSVALNVPAVTIYVDKARVINKDYTLNQDVLIETIGKVKEVLGKDVKVEQEKILERVNKIWDGYDKEDKGWVQRIEILSEMSNESAVKIKAAKEYIPGVTVDNGSKRTYPLGDSFSHLLGYTGDVFAQDLIDRSYVSFNDIVGKSGLELMYDEVLFGIKGKVMQERDRLGRIVQNGSNSEVPSQSGATVHLTIDSAAQRKMYDILKKGVTQFGADGGAGILQDVQSGEILALASYPSYDNDLFVGGISQKEYSKILKSGKNPLLNRAISAQIPPGSTFKTIVAAAALDAGAITPQTIYVSRRGYTFSDDRPFPEYGNNSYGALNVVSALTVSSNIYFCETIRNWDMDKLVPYLDRFGIGKPTGIDLLGEGSGRLPSPENKIRLAQTSSPWLDDVWYPEGDSCNSVIGQGITTVTPIQMVNWISAIANGGTLNTPKLVDVLEYPDGRVVKISKEPLQKKVVKESALKIVREGMWSSVNSDRRVIIPLSNSNPVIAAKTGTAEFGRVNKDGVYENTHAWVTGFFPYENPKYAFVIFLEDGGASNNSALLARQFIDWFVEKRK